MGIQVTNQIHMIITNLISTPMNFTEHDIGINQSIYKKLVQLIPDLPTSDGTPCKRTSQVTDRRDLHYFYVQKDESGNHFITLSHEYIADNGIDVAPDPEIMIRVVPEKEYAEAMTYQNRHVLQRVYQEYDDEPFIHYRILAELNESLSNWLSRLLVYGHNLEPTGKSTPTREPSGYRATHRAPDNGNTHEYDLRR